MRYFIDTEFIEDGKTIDLVSIAIVAEDGREFYAESSDADLSRADEWVRENVRLRERAERAEALLVEASCWLETVERDAYKREDIPRDLVPRIMEWTGVWVEPDADGYYEAASGIRVFKDGDAWCAVPEDFVNLQESPAGFSEAPHHFPFYAVKALRERNVEDKTV